MASRHIEMHEMAAGWPNGNANKQTFRLRLPKTTKMVAVVAAKLNPCVPRSLALISEEPKFEHTSSKKEMQVEIMVVYAVGSDADTTGWTVLSTIVVDYENRCSDVYIALYREV
jgi:hypothetical protein